LDLKERLKNDRCVKVLELACGAGRITSRFTEILEKDGKIVATDINGDMLAVAKKGDQACVDWQVIDAQELPFDNGFFDHVICQFGVMFFSDKLKAFKEAYRVISKEGKFVFNTWGPLNDSRRSGIIKDVMEDCFKDDAPGFLTKGPTLSILPMLSNPY
jgi:ubiquinone/menaquinone biosynthesis C-methylase UbiE